jgi:hypothetical protein
VRVLVGPALLLPLTKNMHCMRRHFTEARFCVHIPGPQFWPAGSAWWEHPVDAPTPYVTTYNWLVRPHPTMGQFFKKISCTPPPSPGDWILSTNPYGYCWVGACHNRCRIGPYIDPLLNLAIACIWWQQRSAATQTELSLGKRPTRVVRVLVGPALLLPLPKTCTIFASLLPRLGSVCIYPARSSGRPGVRGGSIR